jgi:Domain of unknown function (DUF5666)
MRRASIALALALASAAAPAHEGGHDVRGVVTAVSGEELKVKTSRGEETFALTAGTEFVKDGKPATAQDLKPSQRVVVHSKKQHGRFEAIKVQFAGQR